MTLDVAKLDRRYEALRDERSGWDAAWRDLAELFSPTRWRSDTDEDEHKRPKINGRLLDGAGVLAMRTLAAGLQGGMTSPVRPWFRLKLAQDREQEARGEGSGINAWLDEVTERMRLLLHQSNFYNEIHSLYSDLGTFGTGLMVETADEQGLIFSRVPCGEYVLDIDGRGMPDAFFRRLNLTARQVLDLWPDAPEQVQSMAKNGAAAGGAIRLEVIHGVFPRKDRAWGKLVGARGKPYVSVYWLRGVGGGGGKPSILSEGGFDMFPGFAPRWDIHPTDVYGRSPAMDVLPDARMLQAMTETLRRTQHKLADPPLLADADFRRYGVDASPGALNFGSLRETQGRPLVMPIQQPDAGALQYGQQAVDSVKASIERGLYVDLFRMLLDDTRTQITATEIQARQAEKMLLIGPVVERLHSELLSPLIKRTYGLMNEWGALPEPPDGLSGVELDVEFESVLAQAQRLTATSSIDQGVAFLANLAAAAPQALDVLDIDAVSRAYLDRIGIPQGCIADEEDVRAAREARAQQQAAEQQAAELAAAGQAAQDFTGAARNLGQTPAGADGQTLMQTLLGGMGG